MGPLPLGEEGELWLASIVSTYMADTVERYRDVLERVLYPALRKDMDLALVDGETLSPPPGRHRKTERSRHLRQWTAVLYHVAVEWRLVLPRKPQELTFRLASSRWLAQKQKELDPEACDSSRGTLNRFILPLLGNRKLDTIDSGSVRYFFQQLNGQELSTSQLLEIHTIIQDVFDYAVKRGWMKTAPELPVSEAERVTYADRPFLLSEREALMTVLRTDPRTPGTLVIRLAWQLGLTRQEIHDLTWADVDMAKAEVHLASREVPLPIPSDLLALLSQIWGDAPAEGAVFLTTLGSVPAMGYLSMIPRYYLAPHGLPNISLDDLRRDYIVQLLEIGNNYDETALLAGNTRANDLRQRYGKYAKVCNTP